MNDKPAKHVAPLDTGHWPDTLDGVCADMDGQPINVHKLMAHSPRLLNAWWDFRNYSVTGGSLGLHLGELVILRVGVHLGAWYEWGSHVDRALKIEMSKATIFETLQAKPDLTEPEVLVLAAVDELMLERQISKPNRAKLEQHFSTAQLMDLIAIQGMYVILGGFINTWDLALDDAVEGRITAITQREDFERAAADFRKAIKRN